MSTLRTAVAALAAAAALAQDPAGVLVVINRNSAASREAGAYYVHARRVPARIVCVIATTTDEEIDRSVYVRQIAAPIKAFLRERGLAEQVLYLVTTIGVLLKIRGSSGIAGSAAAVDSELALRYSELKGKRFQLEGAVRNPYFGQSLTPFAHPRFPLYLVTRLAAFDLAGVKAMIGRSLAAAHRGRFVIDDRPGAERCGSRWLHDAAARLPKDRVVFDGSAEVVYGVADVIGYASWGSNDRNRKRRHSGFGWLPGAIATQFVSTDGRTFARPPAGTSDRGSGATASSPVRPRA